MTRFSVSLFRPKHAAAAYVAEREANASFKANTEAIDGLRSTLTVDEAKLMAEFVKDVSSAEASREASIQSRAQGLLVGQVLIASMVTIGGGATAGKGPFSDTYWTYVILTVIAVVVAAGIALTKNALWALSGQEYPRPGMTEFREALSAEQLREKNATKPSFQAAMASHAFNSYRRAVVRNDWRFAQLARAQRSFWISVLGLAALAGLMLVSVFLLRPPAPPTPAVVVVRIPAFSLAPPPYTTEELTRTTRPLPAGSDR